MNPIIYIGGSSEGAGKTFVSLGMLNLLKQTSRVAAWKPIDVGQMNYNQDDTLEDGERLRLAADMEENVNLVNPFLLNENLPPTLAARRDGIKLEMKIINRYFEILNQRFDRIVIEGSRGLYVPLTEELNELDFLLKYQPQVIWVTSIGERALSETLLQINTLKQTNIEVLGIILTNRDNIKNMDLIHYQWLTLEEQLSVKVFALLPFLASGLEDPAKIGNLLNENFDKEYSYLLN